MKIWKSLGIHPINKILPFQSRLRQAWSRLKFDKKGDRPGFEHSLDFTLIFNLLVPAKSNEKSSNLQKNRETHVLTKYTDHKPVAVTVKNLIQRNDTRPVSNVICPRFNQLLTKMRNHPWSVKIFFASRSPCRGSFCQLTGKGDRTSLDAYKRNLYHSDFTKMKPRTETIRE